MIQVTTASRALATIRAKQAVKRELQAQELMPDAIAQAKRMFLSGTMGKRAQKEFIEELQIEQSQGERSVANG
jgi:hypothetical protein